jgi:hypothetical protein
MKQYLHPVQLLPIHEDQIATVAYLNHESTARESWDNAITGTFNSLAKAFKFREMVEISCSLFPPFAIPSCCH